MERAFQPATPPFVAAYFTRDTRTPLLILTLLLAGCAENPSILGIVKAGTLPSTTKNIGKAFDDAFPGGTWSTSTTGMGEGEMLSEFHSTTTAEALEASGVSPLTGRTVLAD